LIRPSVVLTTSLLVLVAGEAPGQARKPPPGTYEFTLCHPTCRDSSSHVGRGVFVVVDGDIRQLLTDIPLDSVEEVGWRSPPNACFRVSADSEIGGREYYPSIIPIALSAVTEAGRDFSLRLYASPDAFFSLILRFDDTGRVSGQGRQNDWNGQGRVEFSVMSGHRKGPPDPRVCFDAH